MCQERGIEIDHDVIPNIAHGFAGGIGNTGSVCGAVIGAVMAIGLERGRASSMKDALRELGWTGELRRRFEQRMGSIQCRELTGLNLTTPEGIAHLMESDIPQRVCFPAVSTAYRLALELLDEAATDDS